MDLRPTGKKTNHKKGIAAADRLRKREEAEARNAHYQSLPLELRMERNSTKVKAKIGRIAKINAQG